MAYDKVVDSALLDAGLTEIANAIRTKGGTTDNLAFPDGFTAAVNSISGGGALIIGTEDLHNRETDIANKYYEKGVLTAYNNWSATDYIPVVAGKVYAVHISSSSIECLYAPFFDENKNYVRVAYNGGYYTSGSGGFCLFVPPVTGYIAFSGPTARITDLEIYECQGSYTQGV